MRILVTASEGSAEIVGRECEALGLDVYKVRRDAVEMTADSEQLATALVWLRTGERVLVHLHSFECNDATTLYAGALEVPWNHWLDPSVSIAVTTTGKLPPPPRDSKKPLRTHVFASQVIKDAIVDRVREQHGIRPDVVPRDPDVRVVARIFGDRCGLFLDATGSPLNWRGYRHTSVKAPLTETAAAAFLHDAGYTGSRALVDPMCGSGTIAIEAGMMAAGIAPGGERAFGIERWPLVPDKFHRALERVRQKARNIRRAANKQPRTMVQGFDVDPEAVTAARTNAKMAGVGGWVHFDVADIADLQPPAAGTLVATNPPYGERIGDDVVELYKTMGAVLGNCKGCDLAILDGHDSFPDAFGLAPERTSRMRNGQLKILLHHWRVEA